MNPSRGQGFWSADVHHPSADIAEIGLSASRLEGRTEFRILFARGKGMAKSRWIEVLRELPLGKRPGQTSHGSLSFECRGPKGVAVKPEQVALVAGADELILNVKYKRLPSAWTALLSWDSLGVTQRVFNYR